MGPWARDYDLWLDNYGNPGILDDEEYDEAFEDYQKRFGTGNVSANDEKDVY